MNCTVCSQDHEHQRTDYPVGALIKALIGFAEMSAGTIGTVIHHCADGRAMVDFGGNGRHSFHHPNGYIAVTTEDVLVQYHNEIAALREQNDTLVHRQGGLRTELQVIGEQRLELQQQIEKLQRKITGVSSCLQQK